MKLAPGTPLAVGLLTDETAAPRLVGRLAMASGLAQLEWSAEIIAEGLPLSPLHYPAEPVQLLRTREGHSFNIAHYRRADTFLLGITPGTAGDWPDSLYQAGIVAQLALSSHLLDVCFPDHWCARQIGLEVARSLANANATGLGYQCDETARLAQVLTPYWKWNRRALVDTPVQTTAGSLLTMFQTCCALCSIT